MKRWLIRWDNNRPGTEQKELAATFEDRARAEAMVAYIETEKDMKLREFKELG